MIKTNWSQLKTFVDSRALSIQWVETDEAYYLVSADGYFALECVLMKNNQNGELADFEANYKANGNKKVGIGILSPFASKTLENKKLFKRVHGVTKDVIFGETEILYAIPYPWVKINGIEVINGTTGDRVSFFILDSATGTYSTVPNFQLNQFAFDVNIAKDYYMHKSEFDADLYQGMQIKIVYTSVAPKTVGINFLMNELK